jgi:hypothetical protein
MAGKASAATPRGKNQVTVTGRTNPAEAPDAVRPKHPGAPTEEAIRARAFYLWEAAGRPESDGVEFWLRAEQELTTGR